MSIIALASDHRGFSLKTDLLGLVSSLGHSVLDLGTNSEERCNGQDYALNLVRAMKDGSAHFGILICGSGNAMAMIANRYSHIRAALCHDITASSLARRHNDANVLSIGAHLIGVEVARDCVRTFLSTSFDGGVYAERVAKMAELPPIL